MYSLLAAFRRALRKPVVTTDNDPELAEFLRDAAALRTSVEHKWTAWLDGREDGITGTGSTEVEAIKSLAHAQRTANPIVQQPTDPGG